MLVTEMLKLAPSAEQREALLATMRACNAAANRAAEVAFEHRTANKIALQKLGVRRSASRVRLVGADGHPVDLPRHARPTSETGSIKPVFRELGAVAYDQRILSWKGRDTVSILTLTGRITVPVVYQGRWLKTSGATARGQADLLYRDGMFFLAVVIDVPEAAAG